ncbi:Plasma membrane sulfite pump involved in sulfite metabolism, partial [Spiromyces aspiralis]
MPVEVAGPIQNESQLEQRPLRQLKVKDIIRHFTPSWFSVTMGTGILGILLYSLPYKFDGLEFIGGTIFAINTTIYVLFSIVTLARYTIFPEVFKLMLSHPQQSMFIGTIPMGLATIVNSLVIMIPMSKYPWVPYVAWGLWWLDVALTLGSVLITPFS